MAIVHFSTAVAEAVLVPVRDAIDAGTTGGTINIYKGTMPATTAVAASPTDLLGTLTFATTCGTIGTPTAKALTMSAITSDTSADATGTASWARIADSTGVAIMDIDCSITGGTGALQLNTTNIVQNGPILITSFVISVG